MADLPLPHPTPESAPFWEACRRGELLVQRCAGCGEPRHPPRPMCRRCGSLEREWAPASGRGTVYSYVITHQAVHPAFEGRVPFATVLVELEEGVRMTSNVVDCAPEEIEIGMPVEVTFERVNDEITLPKFRRVAPPA